MAGANGSLVGVVQPMRRQAEESEMPSVSLLPIAFQVSLDPCATPEGGPKTLPPSPGNQGSPPLLLTPGNLPPVHAQGT